MSVEAISWALNLAPMKEGQPVRRGLYRDPGGQTGLRYWDGRQWSPLLPTDIVRPGSVRPQQNPATSWSQLPTADARWTYAATQARRLTVWCPVFALTAAVLLAGAVMVHQRWDHANDDPSLLLWTASAVLAVWALRAFMGRRFFLKLDKAAHGGSGSFQGLQRCAVTPLAPANRKLRSAVTRRPTKRSSLEGAGQGA